MDERYFLKVNTKLNNRYIVQRPVGSGGFGITYKAQDMQLNKPCCIKELFPRDTVYRTQGNLSLAPFSSDRQRMMNHCIQRFGEEAQVLQKLGHVESVVNIYDFFYENNTCYFVMEFLDGMNLSTLMKNRGGKLDLNTVMEVAEKAGRALIEVHKNGIFHRDISPDNIFITNSGAIKLIDFGNAKHLVKREGEIRSVVLKKGFAPMEQYSSKGIQGTYTDVYSFACTLYYALTGVKPPDVFDRQSEDYKKLTEFGFSQELSDAFDRALAISYKMRTQTIDAFLKELRVPTEPVRPKPPYTPPVQSDTPTGKTATMMPPTPPKIVTPPPVPQYVPSPALEVYVQGRYYGCFKIRPNMNIVVGRKVGVAGFIVDEEHVSSRHCEVFYSTIDRMFIIMDHSTNGTYINGVRARKEGIETAKAGDQIALGSMNGIIILKEV